MSLPFLLHQTVCGAIAAAGFGLLFNVGMRQLPWCAGAGALALAVRSYCTGQGWSLVGASFAAALAVGAAVQLLRWRTELSQTALDVVGCIPMVPGSLAAKAILGLFAAASKTAIEDAGVLMMALQYTLSVTFVTGAIGTGLAIPTLLLRLHAPVRHVGRPEQQNPSAEKESA
jgi:uncharacterized membrane protein YjjB (DUF3815 family)